MSRKSKRSPVRRQAPLCSWCSHPVLWRVLVDERGTPRRLPVVPMGQVYVAVNEGTVESQTAYLRHTCDHDAVEAKQQRDEARRAGALAEAAKNEEQRLAYANLKDEAYRLAMTRVCPKCLAEVGQRCKNRASYSPKFGQPTVWPHPDRVLDEVEITDDMLATATEED